MPEPGSHVVPRLSQLALIFLGKSAAAGHVLSGCQQLSHISASSSTAVSTHFLAALPPWENSGLWKPSWARLAASGDMPRGRAAAGSLGDGEGHSPTSEGRPHGEIMVLHSEKWLRFSPPDFGHVEVLLIKVTAKTRERHFSLAHQGTERECLGRWLLANTTIRHLFSIRLKTHTPSHPFHPLSAPGPHWQAENQTLPEPS